MTAAEPLGRKMMVSFSGIDGAGKSTQIANLCAHLHAAGKRVSIVTFWDDVATLKSMREGAGHKIFKGDKGVGSPDAPIERRDKNVRSPLMTMVRLGLYFLDTLSLRRATRRVLRSESDVIIFDRYLYDELANLNFNRGILRLYVRLLLRLVRRPDVSLVLDADPVEARKRKPEYPLDFLHENREAYLRLARVLGGFTVIPPLPLSEAKAAVVGAAMQRLPMASAQGETASDGAAPSAMQPPMRVDEREARPLAS